jgi:starch phosphorylase
VKSASDLGVPLVAVGLLYRDGYFTQEVDAEGRQHELYRHLKPEQQPLTPELNEDGSPLLIPVPFPGRDVLARIWRADVGTVALYLLDTDVGMNSADDRHITDRLFGGDLEHRLKQELVLGVGGVRAIQALGHNVEVLHLNEGHAAFAVLERIRGIMERDGVGFDDGVRRAAAGVVFTSHTPVEAGHDYFGAGLLQRYIGDYAKSFGAPFDEFLALGRRNRDDQGEAFCMTVLALRTSVARNGVSRLHGAVTRRMWHGIWSDMAEGDVPIGHVTNGIHLPTWAGRSIERIYGEYLGNSWHEETGGFHWERAGSIPDDALWYARNEQRAQLVLHVRRLVAAQEARRGLHGAGAAEGLDPDALTIVFARRFATYKRATLLLTDPARLAQIVNDVARPVQFIFAGNAHPRDEAGKQFVQRIFAATERPEFRGRLIYIENYDVELARQLVQGADVWLNVPRRPLEASGTSGMKAAANGCLNLSVADGWWAEAWQEHNDPDAPIGWIIDGMGEDSAEAQDAADASALYDLLETQVIPRFYDRPEGVPSAWLNQVRSAIGGVCPFFNTNRMVRDYVNDYYRPAMLQETGSR